MTEKKGFISIANISGNLWDVDQLIADIYDTIQGSKLIADNYFEFRRNSIKLTLQRLNRGPEVEAMMVDDIDRAEAKCLDAGRGIQRYISIPLGNGGKADARIDRKCIFMNGPISKCDESVLELFSLMKSKYQPFEVELSGYDDGRSIAKWSYP